jgi:hypothetical protein
VSIDGVDQDITGGSDTELVIGISNVQGVGDGKTVTLLVSNPNKGSASTQFLLLPFQPTVPTGNLSIAMTKPPVDIVIVGRVNPYLFTFTVTAISSLDEDFELKAAIDQLGWSATPVDAGNKPLAQIGFPKSDSPGTKKEVVVSVVVPTGAPDKTVGNLTLTVTSKKNPKDFHNFGGTQITVNAPPQPAQDKVVVTFKKVIGGSVNPNDNAIEIPKNTQATLSFNARVKQTGNHTASATLDKPTGWTLPQPAGFNAQAGSEQAPSDNPLKVSITPGGTAAEAKLSVKVSLDSDPGKVFGQVLVTVRPV